MVEIVQFFEPEICGSPGWLDGDGEMFDIWDNEEEKEEAQASLKEETWGGWVQAVDPLWFSFHNKKYCASFLLMGHMHNIISFQDFEKLHFLWSIFGISLPHWTTLRNSRDTIQGILGMNPVEILSIFDNKCYSLNFYAEYKNGINSHKLYQSQQWREELLPKLHPKMVEIRNKHFYFYEPVKLKSLCQEILI
ncbi:hypothetical protein VP01_3159g1 [Puccinia sorghi]|uniref:Uncharacterized protein n=1 Tax=Puccinia sorghi TaxID=27349 RepID=A0A0L6UZ07_9BASI|nr:hypothetical protein VP01_3159g1 [Puccinia sorghi]